MSIYDHHPPIQPQSIHHHPQFLNHTSTVTRPTLKRSQSPYTSDLLSSSSQDSKKRKTSSTTCAFSKLSLNTTNTDHQTPTSSSSLNVEPKLLLESDHHSDQQMKSIYSSYEIEPNRIIVNSIGSEPSTPIEESSSSLLNQFKINYQLALIHNRIDLPFIKKEDQQQLVIYKAPIHLTLNHLHSSREDQSEHDFINNVEVPMELD